jgi:hypothetical protein
MRALVIIPRVFALIGFVMLLVTSYTWSGERRFVREAARATGTVTDFDYSRDSDGGGSYHPIVAFTTEAGERVSFRSRAGRNPPAFAVGETVPVLYARANPQAARTATFFGLYGGSFVTGLLAVIFGAIGFTWLGIERRAKRIAEECRRFGQRIEAKVARIELRANITVNRRHPWRVVAEHEGRLYYSPNLWDDPTGRVGDTVTLFVDRYHPNRYVMEVDLAAPSVAG